MHLNLQLNKLVPNRNMDYKVILAIFVSGLQRIVLGLSKPYVFGVHPKDVRGRQNYFS